MSSMNVGRNYPAVVAWDDQIYGKNYRCLLMCPFVCRLAYYVIDQFFSSVIGGNTGFRRLSTVERYDSSLNQVFSYVFCFGSAS